ncbi:E3 ubiquitin-protein ligase TRAIP [Copidosoma floridanum]|uniref:E3 ubiquitin-protein ligase TRAIP n=1 Tax=Copidosoma floridanum TaxID=29053 RepID=UPI0006C9D79C|nr:E3 ubiquitin-protein ligase TRAIP [Copidosoma floridanum]
MNVLCAICQDLLVPSNDIFMTPCGHVFHFPCLMQWLEKNPSCPECRQRVLRNKITRIYFNFTTAEDVKEDSVALQQKVDGLVFKVKLKETENRNYINKNAELNKQILGLKEENKKIESQLRDKKAIIRGLKDESSHFQERCKDYEKLKNDKEKLSKEIGMYECVKKLVRESEQDVSEMVNEIEEASTLKTYVSVLKKQLVESMAKIKYLRARSRKLEQTVQTVRMEKTSITSNYLKQIEELQEALALSISEFDELKKKYNEMKSGTNEIDKASTEESQSCSKIAESRKRGVDDKLDLNTTVPPKKLKESFEHLHHITLEDSDDPDISFSSSVPVPVQVKKSKENEENSPYLPTKSRNVLSVKDKDSQVGTFSLKPLVWSSKKLGSTFKNSGRQDKSIAFDGFGGHSKQETFPVPKTSPSKLKRPASDSLKTKKIKLDLANNRHMDSFVINLT